MKREDMDSLLSIVSLMKSKRVRVEPNLQVKFYNTHGLEEQIIDSKSATNITYNGKEYINDKKGSQVRSLRMRSHLCEYSLSRKPPKRKYIVKT